MTTRICFNYKRVKKVREAGEEGEATEFDHSWGKDDPRRKLSGWKEVPDAEPTTLDEIRPYTEGEGGPHNCLVLREGDRVNITLDLDDKTLRTEDEMTLQMQACKDWYKKDLRKAFGVTDKDQWINVASKGIKGEE